MKLIGSLTSPFVRKIRIALLEKNIPFEMMIDMPMNADTKVSNYNPLGKVPILIGDDESIWYDSDLLTEYLETLDLPRGVAQIPLLPHDRRAALPVRQTMALADGVADAGVLIFLEKRRSADKQDEKWVARQSGKVERGIAALEELAKNKTYLHGDTLSAADIAAACILLWLEFRMPEFPWRAQHPALNALCTRLSERSSFVQTVPVA